MFQFVNSYVALFYVAFLKGRVPLFGEVDHCEPDCLSELMICLSGIFLTQMLVQQFIEVGAPLLTGKLKGWVEEQQMKRRSSMVTGDVEAGEAMVAAMSEAEEQSKMPPYESTFDDYNEMIIQWGYVTLFAAAFPLGPLFALLNNTVEMRSDAYKMLVATQRPAYQGAEDIGTWYGILNAMVTISVLTNIANIAFTSRQLEYMGWAETDLEKLMVVFALEHIILMAKFLLEALIPDIPEDVQEEMTRQAFGIQQAKRTKAMLDEITRKEASFNAKAAELLSKDPLCRTLLNKPEDLGQHMVERPRLKKRLSMGKKPSSSSTPSKTK